MRTILNDASNHIDANVGGLMSALKARLSDSNKNLAQTTIVLLGNIATAMGKAAEKHVKVIAGALLDGWSDNKKTVRESVSAAVDAFVQETGPEPFVHFGTYFVKPQCIGERCPRARVEADRLIVSVRVCVGARCSRSGADVGGPHLPQGDPGLAGAPRCDHGSVARGRERPDQAGAQLHGGQER